MNDIEPVADEPTEDYGLLLLYNIVYCSQIAESVNQAVVDQIVAIARRVNPAKGVTGLLVFGSGIFFQWLEGPREHVTQLMANISRDPRHTSIILLSESEEVGERLFPDWAMELVAAEDIRPVLEDALSTAEDATNRRALQQLLRQLDTGEINVLGGS